MAALDYKKEYKDLYLPRQNPMLIDMPPILFAMVEGIGAPDSEAYQNALGVLYSVSYSIKMSKMGNSTPDGYFDYVVPPLEGLWWWDTPGPEMPPRDTWRWVSMIRQPEFVTPEVFAEAVAAAKKKKPELDFSALRLETFHEGLCVQIMHIGPYSEEERSIAQLHAFIEQQGLRDETGTRRKHHEIYLGDPRKTAPEKLRTVLRLPVAKL